MKQELQAMDTERRRRDAERRAAAQPTEKETWDVLIAEGEGTWRMKVIEHIALAPDGWTEPTFDDRTWNEATVPISWTMYHTSLFRGKFHIEDKTQVDALRVCGKFFQQANVVIHLNGKLVAKVDNLGRGIGNTIAPLTGYAVKLLKDGENTMAISSRHQRRWGSYRGTYKSAATVSFAPEAKKKD